MPELPEVETVRRELEPWLVGRRIRRARRVDAPRGPKYAGLERARGRRILGVARRGKFLLLPLSGGLELVIHLGMTGTLTAREPDGHVRAVLELHGRAPARLYFRDPRRFGRMLVVGAGDYAALPTLARMGPEPLSDDFQAPAFFAALQSSSAIKTLLLGQRPVAGLGNIYADEALWTARIHPRREARQLSRRKTYELCDAIEAVLSAGVEAGGTTLRDYRSLGGQPGGYAPKLQVYGRAGEPCPRCGAAICRIVVGGRSSHLCPRCQRWPAQRG